MSWWIYLEDGAKSVDVKEHQEGGTVVIGGSSEAELNVTYNYSEVTRLMDFNFKELHEKKASETIDKLKAVLEVLKDRPYTADYWAPTPGNAGHAVAILLNWAEQYPDAIWRVS